MTVLELVSAEYDLHSDVIDLRYQALVTCLEQLTEDDLSLVRKRYWGDAKLRDIAASAGVADKQIYQQMQRIMLGRILPDAPPEI